MSGKNIFDQQQEIINQIGEILISKETGWDMILLEAEFAKSNLGEPGVVDKLETKYIKAGVVTDNRDARDVVIHLFKLRKLLSSEKGLLRKLYLQVGSDHKISAKYEYF